MKVSELLEFLNKCPAEAIVMVEEGFNKYGDRQDDKWKELVIDKIKVDCRVTDFVNIP